MLNLVLEYPNRAQEIGQQKLFSIGLDVFFGQRLTGYALELDKTSIKRHTLDGKLGKMSSLSVHFWFDQQLIEQAQLSATIRRLEKKKLELERSMDAYPETPQDTSWIPEEARASEHLAEGQCVSGITILSGNKVMATIQNVAECSCVQIRAVLTKNGERARFTAMGLKDDSGAEPRTITFADLELIESGEVKVIFHRI